MLRPLFSVISRAREPVAVRNLHARGLDVALAPHEVPQEVAPVHVRELVVEEEVEVLGEGRFDDRAHLAVARVVDPLAAEVEHLGAYRAARLVADDLAVLVTLHLGLGAVGGPLHVFVLALGVVPHAREEVHELRRVGVSRDGRNRLVAAVLVEVVGLLLSEAVDRRRVVGSIEQRAVAVLVAVEQRQQREGVVGVVGVHRRVGRGADRHRGVGGVADEHHGRRQQDEVQHDAPPAVEVPGAPAQPEDQRQREDDHTRVDGQSERVDEKEVDHRSGVDRVGDDDVVDEDQDGARDQRGVDDALESHLLRRAEIVDEHQRRDGQQVEDVHADRQSHHVGDQYDPA